uniref:Uncharacterized protein n=1 Tax=Lates calcarifer TaxID=8187 RepID=A0A4W6EQ49_LATCA
MMPPDPLRSAMTIGNAEDTSLAVPSDNKLRSGQQRVLDQVHTIKRSKSKHGKNGSLSPSPTSVIPQTLTTYSEFGSFKFLPGKANGTYSRSTATTGYSKGFNVQKSRTMSTKTLGGRHFSSSGTWEQQIKASNWPQSPNGLKPSRSDPALAPPFSPAPAPVQAPAPLMRAKGQTVQSQHTVQTRVNRHSTYSMTNGSQLTNSQTRMVRPPSAQSHTEGKMGTIKTSKIELQQSAINSGINLSEITLKEAVEYLSHPDDNFQQFGATFIQHTTFKEERAKQEVRALSHKYTANASSADTPSKHAEVHCSLFSHHFCVSIVFFDRNSSKGALYEDLCVTCLKGKGGESICHHTWLLALFVAQGAVNASPHLKVLDFPQPFLPRFCIAGFRTRGYPLSGRPAAEPQLWGEPGCRWGSEEPGV